MSRVNAKSGNRCPNCGGRMRLVNVTWVDKFQSPEASQYDQSVSRRNALLKIAPKLTTQEMMCTSCAERSPLSIKEAKLAKGKAAKAKRKKLDKKARKLRRKRIGRVIKFVIFLAIVAAAVYFGYQYQDTLLGVWETIVGFISSIEEMISNFQK